MKYSEIIQEILLAFMLAIIIPVIVYWGVQVFSINNTSYVTGYNTVSIDTTEKNIKQDLNKKDIKKIESEKQFSDNNKIKFWAFLISAILAILVGSFIKINSLSLGLIGGGIINILFAIIHSLNNPVLNFFIFLFILILFICLIIFRKK